MTFRLSAFSQTTFSLSDFQPSGKTFSQMTFSLSDFQPNWRTPAILAKNCLFNCEHANLSLDSPAQREMSSLTFSAIFPHVAG
jgi:hypothetical protein